MVVFATIQYYHRKLCKARHLKQSWVTDSTSNMGIDLLIAKVEKAQLLPEEAVSHGGKVGDCWRYDL